ncbi:dyslexia-associated protein KIAA0319-like protein isoform X2 [Lethenteron reissneri]|uniref:dyslexia-associated protein KIAA0319-like protein isoform X2 n=1 Tax=Lethenteron reissneri TaxID=7753 RepID=UPI002AB6F29C|nr:dyslexia-associated protein KIAA0319-like protein isoform X2 [Lethenteron reissneri]
MLMVIGQGPRGPPFLTTLLLLLLLAFTVEARGGLRLGGSRSSRDYRRQTRAEPGGAPAPSPSSSTQEPRQGPTSGGQGGPPPAPDGGAPPNGGPGESGPAGGATTVPSEARGGGPNGTAGPPVTTGEPPTSGDGDGRQVKRLALELPSLVEVTLPINDIWINVTASPPPPPGYTYDFVWTLMSHPAELSGLIEGEHTSTLRLSQLSAGKYVFRITVTGPLEFGEAFSNVTINPAPRVNQPPVAVALPRSQELTLPAASTFIDGSQSQDDDGIASYRWEQVRGPTQESGGAGDTAVLSLNNLVPGSYAFRLTVVDTDGVSDSTEANVTVTRPVDRPPVADAGPTQVLTLPQSELTLNGNQSADDHAVTTYEWAISPSSQIKVVNMQGVRTPYLHLSALQEGEYVFQLTVADVAGQHDTAQVSVIVQPEVNLPPVADAGPDKELTAPSADTTLDGSRSHDDRGIVGYLWEKTSGPDGPRLTGVDRPELRVAGLGVGVYGFRLTVRDAKGLVASDVVSVTVRQEVNERPVSRAGGAVTVTLPAGVVRLNGSLSSDDQGIVSFRWQRDEASPAAGEVLEGSDSRAVLLLSNVVEGSYQFHLTVTDARGLSHTDTAHLEVQQDPLRDALVELVLEVDAPQLLERHMQLLKRKLALLLGLQDQLVHVHAVRSLADDSTAVILHAERLGEGGGALSGLNVSRSLRRRLAGSGGELLPFAMLRVDTQRCQLPCSGHGHCDGLTRSCRCQPFWMEDPVRSHLGDGESNCDWSVLYVGLALLGVTLALGAAVWLLAYSCRRCSVCVRGRSRGASVRRSRYRVLGSPQERDSLELRSRGKRCTPGGRHKAMSISSPGPRHRQSDSDSDRDSMGGSGLVGRAPHGRQNGGLASHMVPSDLDTPGSLSDTPSGPPRGVPGLHGIGSEPLI